MSGPCDDEDYAKWEYYLGDEEAYKMLLDITGGWRKKSLKKSEEKRAIEDRKKAERREKRRAKRRAAESEADGADPSSGAEDSPAHRRGDPGSSGQGSSGQGSREPGSSGQGSSGQGSSGQGSREPGSSGQGSGGQGSREPGSSGQGSSGQKSREPGSKGLGGSGSGIGAASHHTREGSSGAGGDHSGGEHHSGYGNDDGDSMSSLHVNGHMNGHGSPSKDSGWPEPKPQMAIECQVLPIKLPNIIRPLPYEITVGSLQTAVEKEYYETGEKEYNHLEGLVEETDVLYEQRVVWKAEEKEMKESLRTMRKLQRYLMQPTKFMRLVDELQEMRWRILIETLESTEVVQRPLHYCAPIRKKSSQAPPSATPSRRQSTIENRLLTPTVQSVTRTSNRNWSVKKSAITAKSTESPARRRPSNVNNNSTLIPVKSKATPIKSSRSHEFAK